MFKPTYLYIKTHNKTGLKYFGKTTNSDPHIYQGSGTLWKQHILEHGYDVTTEIIGYYTDENECIQTALKFSIDNNICESDEWANMMHERGVAGGFDYINSNNLNLSAVWNEDSIQRHKEGSSRGGKHTVENKLGIHGLDKHQISINGKKGAIRVQEVMIEKYGVKSIFSILNKDEEFRAKHRAALKAINHQQGESNSQYGTCWIHNLDMQTSKRIHKDDLNQYLGQGWLLGRVVDFNKILIEQQNKQNKLLEKQKYRNEQTEYFTKLWNLYQEYGYNKMLEISGYNKSKANFFRQCKKYVENYHK